MGSPFYVHLTSLAKHDVFEPIVQTLLVLNPLDKYGYFFEDIMKRTRSLDIRHDSLYMVSHKDLVLKIAKMYSLVMRAITYIPIF